MRNIRLLRNIKSKKYIPNKLGLHCHCADTKHNLLELLEKAKNENVGTLAINNYKNLNIYTNILPQLSTDDLTPYKNIKLVPSIEMPGNFNYTNLDGQNYNIELHIIGYGVDISKENLLQDFCKKKYLSIDQEKELQRLISIGHEIGLNFDDKDVYLDLEDDNRKFAGRAFVQALMKNMDDNFCQSGEKNNNKLPCELRTDWRAFQNKCVKDLNSPFYLDFSYTNPNVSEVIDLIHNMGGKAYLAHPSAYFAKIDVLTPQNVKSAFGNVTKFAKDFLRQYSPKNNPKTHIDGAEVYHPSYLGEIEVISEIKELIKHHHIGSSGGTDIHVDKTLGSHETVSSDGLGGNITKSKLRKYRNIRKKAIKIEHLRQKIIDMQGKEIDR